MPGLPKRAACRGCKNGSAAAESNLWLASGQIGKCRSPPFEVFSFDAGAFPATGKKPVRPLSGRPVLAIGRILGQRVSAPYARRFGRDPSGSKMPGRRLGSCAGFFPLFLRRPLPALFAFALGRIAAVLMVRDAFGAFSVPLAFGSFAGAFLQPVFQHDQLLL